MAVKSIFLFAVAVAVNMYNVRGLPDSYYMEDYCPGSGSQISVGNNGVNLFSQRGRQYQNNLDCTLTFYTKVDQVLILASDLIQVEEGLDCIDINDGQYTSSLPSMRHCTNNPLRYITTQRFLTISMTTDSSVTNAGFILSVTTYDDTLADKYYMEDYCTGSFQQLRVENNGVNLYSQRGVNYRDNLDCTLTFFTTIQQSIILQSQRIELEDGLDCIKLFDGQYTTSTPVSHCSNEVLLYSTTQRYLTIQMTTDSSTNFAGFQLSVMRTNISADVPCLSGYGTYQCHDGNGCYFEYEKCSSSSPCLDKSEDMNCDHCDDNSFYCVSSRQCVSQYKVCDLTYDCPNGEDENIPECYPSIWWYWSGGQVAGLIIGYVIFLVIVIAIVAVVNRKCKK